ncbi:hypothetical protein E8E13_008975 [Curvularia kusanoi]|uniref:C2H2-type domain-containing protein n=1 Tax=Curvularia kusanoi TaxID=90978 RepID=A0A9P4TC45_CURKU|nr:hypothetical protein E8E13_008975 [Curvularia kusanoi]
MLRKPNRFADQIASDAVLDEFDRFKLWAGNIAAHRKDYRLRDAAQLKAETNSLLASLEEALKTAMAIVQGQRLPWDEESFTDSDSDSGSSHSGSELNLQGDTELRQLFARLKSLITSLMRISMAIREPVPNRQARSIDKSHFEQHDVWHVQAKFPEAPQYLTERLGRAISSRRQYLTYREVHHDKLKKGIDKLGLDAATTEFTTNSTEATKLQRTDREDRGSMSRSEEHGSEQEEDEEEMSDSSNPSEIDRLADDLSHTADYVDPTSVSRENIEDVLRELGPYTEEEIKRMAQDGSHGLGDYPMQLALLKKQNERRVLLSQDEFIDESNDEAEVRLKDTGDVWGPDRMEGDPMPSTSAEDIIENAYDEPGVASSSASLDQRLAEVQSPQTSPRQELPSPSALDYPYTTPPEDRMFSRQYIRQLSISPDDTEEDHQSMGGRSKKRVQDDSAEDVKEGEDVVTDQQTTETGQAPDIMEGGFVTPDLAALSLGSQKSHTRADLLRRHQRNHHEAMICAYPDCGKTFLGLILLMRHEKRHNEASNNELDAEAGETLQAFESNNQGKARKDAEMITEGDRIIYEHGRQQVLDTGKDDQQMNEPFREIALNRQAPEDLSKELGGENSNAEKRFAEELELMVHGDKKQEEDFETFKRQGLGSDAKMREEIEYQAFRRKQIREEKEATHRQAALKRRSDEEREEQEEQQLEEAMRERLAQFGFEENQIDTMFLSEQQNEPQAKADARLDRSLIQLTYPKIRREHLDIATLEYYDLPYEYDEDPNYFIVLRQLSRRETDVLFEHTRRLRSGQTFQPVAAEAPSQQGESSKGVNVDATNLDQGPQKQRSKMKLRQQYSQRQTDRYIDELAVTLMDNCTDEVRASFQREVDAWPEQKKQQIVQQRSRPLFLRFQQHAEMLLRNGKAQIPPELALNPESSS